MHHATTHQKITLSKHTLRKQALFQNLTEAEFDKLLPLIKFSQVNKNDFLIKQQHLSGGIYILLKGLLKVFTSDLDNNETGLTYIRENDFVGELSVIDNTPSSVNVIAHRDSIVLTIPTDICISLIHQKPEFSYQLLLKQANTIRSSNARFIMLQSKSGTRLFYFLKSHVTHTDGPIMYGPLLKHEEIAVMTNLSRETVTRLLSKFRKTNWFRIAKKEVGKQFIIDTSKVDIDTL